MVTDQLEAVTELSASVTGTRVTTETASAWCRRGRRGVRLPAVRGPRGRWLTTRAQFVQWLAATTAAHDVDVEPVPLPQDEVERGLQAFGLGRLQVAEALRR